MMTPDEIAEKIREMAKAGAEAALRHLMPALRPIVEAYREGEIGLAEVRERAAEAIKANEARIDFVLKTQRRMAQSIAQLASQTPGQMRRYPAWRLVRGGSRLKPRGDWPERWAAAGSETGWQGACRDDYVALKDSPIWAALGEGAGGFRDAIGNPFPPFAFGSGMTWKRVSREEAAELGLVEGGNG